MSTTTIKSEEQSAMPAGCRSVAERIAELEKDPKKKAALDAARQRIKEHGWGDEQQPTFLTQPVWNPPLQLNGGYKSGLEMCVIVAATSAGESLFTSHQVVESLTSI